MSSARGRARASPGGSAGLSPPRVVRCRLSGRSGLPDVPLLQAIESFALMVKQTAQMLQSFGTELAETELPNDVQSTSSVLSTHTQKKDKAKVLLARAEVRLRSPPCPWTRSVGSSGRPRA